MSFAVQAVSTAGSITSTDVNLKTINGVTPSVGNGIASTGTQRVTIASDNTNFGVNATQAGTWNVGTLTSITNPVTVTGTLAVTQSGTWTVQPGNTANTTPWLITASLSATSAGMTRFRNTTLVNTAVAVKASAGNWYYYHVYNSGSTDAYFQVYNVAQGSVTVGTTVPDLTFAIPAGGVLDGSFDSAPFSFSTALTIAATSTPGGGVAPGTALLVDMGYV